MAMTPMECFDGGIVTTASLSNDTAYNISAEGAGTLQLTGNIPTGYTPVAIKSCSTSHAELVMYSYSVGSSKTYLYVRNVGTQTRSVAIGAATATVICIKSDKII